MDETLIHSSKESVQDADFSCKVANKGSPVQVFIYKRPFLKEFLRITSEIFELVIYTASRQDVLPSSLKSSNIPKYSSFQYADAILDEIDSHRLINFRLYRENCQLMDGKPIKDLEIINRDLKDVIIIDVNSRLFQKT